jgi:hypothetical protein
MIEKETGLRVVKLSGSRDCIIAQKDRHKNEPIKHLAYRLVKGYDSLPPGTTLKSTCGIDQCVKFDHIINSTH